MLSAKEHFVNGAAFYKIPGACCTGKGTGFPRSLLGKAYV